eukprot:4954142-Ditylum_brightwellii.AAC.1
MKVMMRIQDHSQRWRKQLTLVNDLASGRVRRMTQGPNNRTAGSYHDSPMLNSMIYEVEFSAGKVKDYARNVIAENMLTQIGYEGFTTTMMEVIIDYVKDSA